MKKHGKKHFLGIFIFLAVFAFGTAAIMWLWNAIIPAVVGWSMIDYWQAMGLALLCRLLFGGFGRHCGHAHRHFHERHPHPMEHVIKGRRDFAMMSKADREKFIRQRFYEGVGEKTESNETE